MLIAHSSLALYPIAPSKHQHINRFCPIIRIDNQNIRTIESIVSCEPLAKMAHNAASVLALMMPNVPYYPTGTPSQGLQAHGSYASIIPSITSFPSASYPSSAMQTSSPPYITEGLKGSTTPKWDQWWCSSTSPCPYGFEPPLGKELRKRSPTATAPWLMESDTYIGSVFASGFLVARTAIPPEATMQARAPQLVSGGGRSPLPTKSKDASYWTSVSTSRAHAAASVHSESTATASLDPRQVTGLLDGIVVEHDSYLENDDDDDEGNATAREGVVFLRQLIPSSPIHTTTGTIYPHDRRSYTDLPQCFACTGKLDEDTCYGCLDGDVHHGKQSSPKASPEEPGLCGCNHNINPRDTMTHFPRDIPDLPAWIDDDTSDSEDEDDEEDEDGDGFRSRHSMFEKSGTATGGYPFVYPPDPRPFVRPPFPRKDVIDLPQEEGGALQVRDMVTVTHTKTVTQTSTMDQYLPSEPPTRLPTSQGWRHGPPWWAPILVCLIAAWQSSFALVRAIYLFVTTLLFITQYLQAGRHRRQRVDWLTFAFVAVVALGPWVATGSK